MTETPTGWVTGPLRKFAPLQRGFDLPTSKVVPGEVPVVYSNGVGRYHSTYMLKGPGVVTGRSGTIGRVHFVDRAYWPHNTSLWVTDFSQCTPRYVYYLLQLIGLERFAGGSGVPTLNRNDAHSFEISVPANRDEQIRIAEALTDADNLIAGLECLVEKKHAIKRGMMQQLLTGRTRLPGFTAGWSAVRLRDAGGTYGGLVGKVKEDFGTGSATFITFMEVMSGARLLGSRLERVRVGPSERQNRVERGDVLFNGSSETPEEVALAAVVDYDPTPTTYLNSFCFGYRLKTRDQIDPTYLAHFFRSNQGREIVSVLAQGATRYNIAKTKLMNVSPVLPPIDEQWAIVGALSDVEAEADALNLRLAKARAIKTGMMQQLLTGRTRLPLAVAS